ncbi:putative signal transduction protein with a C-terminal ATPase domain [Desulfosporosinus orientis DSM 765]|uniref:Putative signal transduction protein with a C-terminal ATPase domain n=1 Tax=Desulfosporosinus orientis (strain ATCC 19365 / DSM 765 / NCIMB 8382 / VKM B-1628 / Singapore I) TaxID=768706 RepID=G7WG87_DESOD|nr:sensor histidine kinase [Desulfosporosinus orientis]AET70819.1 putative signal transduction protein with a C-terminal ATPase domain [Desulfosporosinus orientis DSM 765]
MKKKSLIFQLFVALFIILQCLITFLGFLTYKYAESVIQKEVIQLNSNMLQQIAIRINQELKDVEVLASRIAYDTSIIDSLKKSSGGESVNKDQIQKIEGIMAGYIWSYRSTAMLIDGHLIDNRGNNYSTSYSMSSNQDADLDTYAKSLEAGKDSIILPMKSYEKATGGYNYYFQLVRKVEAYISKQTYGLLLLNVNEKLLCDNYIRLTNEEKDFFIVDQNGVIISHKDKNKINKKLNNFNKTNDLNNLNNYYLNEDKLFIFQPISDYGWYIVESVSLQSAMLPLKKVELFLITFGLLCIILTAGVLNVVAKKIAKPLDLLAGKMTEFNKGNLSIQIPDSNYKEFSEISITFNELIQRVNYLLEENINNERQKRLLELDFLQAQINPHFIYNTLSSIRFYVEMGKNTEAEEMLYHFSKLLRRVLSRGEEFIQLKDEIKHLEDYIALQKMRYAKAFTVVFLLEEATLNALIPSFILQPIIENAIFYGLQANRLIEIKVEAQLDNNDLYITISDNGIGISPEEINEIFNKEVQMNKVGILNVHERIKILCGVGYGLTIKENQPQGSKIVLKLRYYA